MHFYLKSFFITLLLGLLTSLSLWGNNFPNLEGQFTISTIFSDHQSFNKAQQLELKANDKANTFEESETYEKECKKNTAHPAKSLLKLLLKVTLISTLSYTKNNFSSLKKIPLFILFRCWKLDNI